MSNTTKSKPCGCFYCNQPMWHHAENYTKDELRARFLIVKGSYLAKRKLHWRQATKEHLHRQCEGGTNRKSNIVKACAYCNSTRGHATPDEHKIAMVALVDAGAHPCLNGW